MNKIVTIIAAVLWLSGPAVLAAGEIAVYRDKDGVINLTDRPAPAGAEIQEIIRYKEKSATDLAAKQAAEEQWRQDDQKRRQDQKIRELSKKAALAREAAEKESALAREKTEAAEAYLERYKQKRRSQRRRHRKTARRVAQDAQDARERANGAIAQANEAQQAVQDATAGRAE